MFEHRYDYRTEWLLFTGTLGRADVLVVMLCYAIYLAIWTIALMDRIPMAAIALMLVGAGVQAAWHYTLIRERTREGCFKAFRVNHWLGFAVFAAIVAGYALR